MAQATRDDVLKALDSVIDPQSGRSVVHEDMIQGLVLKEGHVGFVLEVDPGRGPKAEPLLKACEDAVNALPGVLSVTAVLTAHQGEPVPRPQRHSHAEHRHASAPQAGIPGVGAIGNLLSNKAR